MKTLRISLLATFVLLASFRPVRADNNVSYNQARDLAAYAIAIETGNSKYDVSSARLVYQLTNPVLNIPTAYFFNVGQDAFVIVAGHKASVPIIGMSADDTLQVNNMPDAMKWWVESYCEMVTDAQLQDLQPSEAVAKQWMTYETHSLVPAEGKATQPV